MAMLRILARPDALAIPQSAYDDDKVHLFCEDTLRGLRECANAGYFIVDGNDHLQQEIKKFIAHWPMSHRQRWETFWDVAFKRKRVIKVDLPKADSRDLEDVFGMLIEQAKPDFILAHLERQSLMQSSADRPVRMVRLNRHFSLFSEWEVGEPGQQHRGRIVAQNELSRDQFAEEVLSPILRHTNSVTITDRVIGRVILQQIMDGKYTGAACGNPCLPKHWNASLKWLARTYQDVSTATFPRKLRIRTEVQPKGSVQREINRQLRIVQQGSKELADDLSRGDPAKPELEVAVLIHVVGEGELGLPHDRYLDTVLGAYSIGRGFDLLDKDEKLQDTQLVYVKDIDGYESAFKSWERSPTIERYIKLHPE